MKAKPIMVQGTMSGVGKSLLAAALCRILHEDGYSVAPFKSQNMSNNSYITSEGLEMGRAQVTQAQAACVTPSVLMNPILLKPTTDVGSQVIVRGVSRGNMSARDYFRYKKSLIPDITDAYDTLADRHDVIVIEGAGSPAEINLKSDDIVNMGLAKMVHSPVLLVGDIDRGGVFAQLYGTVSLLERDERALVKATVINKFRGDVSILAPGLSQLYDLVGVPCAGVVPYTYADIDDEDSVSDRLVSGGRRDIDIAVLRLPRISNYTDFSPFSRYAFVSLRYVKKPSELGDPDLIIIPGTKSTISDMMWLRTSGLESSVLKLHSRGTPVFGVCGGYQMMCSRISDPECAEGGGDIAGMGLLPGVTVFCEEKTRRQTEGIIPSVGGIFSPLSGLSYRGYEIHMGHTDGADAAVVYRDGAYGTYVHGIFDESDVADAVVSALCGKKGVAFDAGAGFDTDAYREQQFDRLAKEVRAALDMELIYCIIEEGA